MTVPARPTSRLERITRGSGPGLLLAHGAGGGIEANYGPILSGLTDRYTVVGPDYPGSGSTPPADTPLDLDALADQLVASATDEGLTSFAIASYSLGGPVAIRATIRHPERVTALVLTASFAYPNPRLRLAARLWRELLDAGDRQQLVAYLFLIGVGAPVLDQITGTDLAAGLQTAVATIPPGTPDHLDLLDRVDVREDLPKITVPTLVISTTQDGLVTPYHHHQLAQGIPGAQLAELASGHLPFIERPDEWLKSIHQFLDANRPS